MTKNRIILMLITIYICLASSIHVYGEIKFLLHPDPKITNLYLDESINILLDLHTQNYPSNIDLYFVLLNPQNKLFFGLDWNELPTPVLKNFTVPPNLTISNAPIYTITIPNLKPPISMTGVYIFAIAATAPGTLDFVSQINTLQFKVISKMRPTTGNVETFNGIDFVYIPPGSFNMGSENGGQNERPVHRVNITKGFWLSKYEITQTQWESVMHTNPSHYLGSDLPVDSVTWLEVQEFVQSINDSIYRLPTEAEWEYACRAGSKTEYYWGDDTTNINNYCWWWENGDEKSHPVGLKIPNSWGLYDMIGNVWEWCYDWFNNDYYAISPEDDPQGPSDSDLRVTRGVSFFADSETMDCRSAVRCHDKPDARFPNLGFRLLREELFLKLQ
jgi:formylglycine-generating enzyme required for sulfatase activity